MAKSNKTVKSVKAKNVKAGAAKAAQSDTVKAITLTLDTKQNHSMRVKAQAAGIDLMATHAMTHTSKGYIEQLAAVNRSEMFKVLSKGAVALLIVNGVSNLVRLGSDGFYGRNDKVAARDFDETQMVIGNVNSLVSLYGDAVTVLTEEEARKRFDSQKEQVTRKVGTGKQAREHTGRIIAQGSKGEKVYSVLATAGDKGLMYVNCETLNCAHNWAHRFSQIKSTDAK